MKVTVRLNGTLNNPWHKFCLTQNPFPQIARAEFMHAMQAINSLDGDPLKGTDDIRQRLQGFSEEFIEGCCTRFKSGQTVEFDVFWDER